MKATFSLMMGSAAPGLVAVVSPTGQEPAPAPAKPAPAARPYPGQNFCVFMKHGTIYNYPAN